MSGSGSALRVIVLALVVLAFWFVGRYANGMPEPRGLDTPASDFSAARANATLGRLLGPEIPHPVSSPANAAVRDRVRAEFAALGVKTTIYRATGCNGRPKFGFFVCGTVEDILGEVVPARAKRSSCSPTTTRFPPVPAPATTSPASPPCSKLFAP